MGIKKLITTIMIAATAMTSMSTITVNAVSIEKYVPIVDTLHVTKKETPDEVPAETKTYEDMTDPDGPLVGAGAIPKELTDKMDTELHNDPVPDDVKYDGYYIIKNGEKTYVAGDN